MVVAGGMGLIRSCVTLGRSLKLSEPRVKGKTWLCGLWVRLYQGNTGRSSWWWFIHMIPLVLSTLSLS